MIGAMPVAEHYAIVPGGDDDVLVVDARLPCIRGDVWRLPEVLDRLATLVGRPTYLRLAAQAKTAAGDTPCLHVFDAASGDGERVPLDDTVALAPPELRPALE